MLRVILAASVMLWVTAHARADVITLKDGRVIEGRITEETRGAITVETMVANIRTAEEIPRFRIESIERRPLPEDFFEPKRPDRDDTEEGKSGRDDRPPPSSPVPDDDPRTHYAVVPVEGEIGEAVTASGIRDAIEFAQRRRVNHIVFVIDSPGGYLYEARQIMGVLREFDEETVFHAYIDGGAISAASVFAAGSDHIYVAPDASLGGAVAFTQDNSTGATQVDAKLNSIWASELAARAESKGHPGDAFRAMAEQDAEVWLTEDGRFSAARTTPGDELIDGTKTVLTLRASQMTRAGMAEALNPGPEGIGELRDLPGWSETPRVGARAMATGAKRRQRLIARHADLHRKLDLAIEAANGADPSSGRYYVDRDTGRFTGGSMAKWQQACDAAVGRWHDVRGVLLALAEFDEDASEDGALHLVTDESQGNELYAKVEERLHWLGQNRNLTAPP